MNDAVSVRRERPDDIDAVRDLVSAAFGDEPVADLLDAMRDSPAWLGESFVAEREGRPVGHLSFTRGWVDADRRLVEVLVLSPLSVHPTQQSRGIGTTLVVQALARIEGRDEPLVFLEGSPSYYPRFGFVPASTLGFTPPSVRIPAAAFQVLTLPSYQPWMSGALVYPDVFWAYDAVGPARRGIAAASHRLGCSG